MLLAQKKGTDDISQAFVFASELLLLHDFLYSVLLIFRKLAPGLACRTPHYSAFCHSVSILYLFPFPGFSSFSCSLNKRHSIPKFNLGLSAILVFVFSLATHFFIISLQKTLTSVVAHHSFYLSTVLDFHLSQEHLNISVLQSAQTQDFQNPTSFFLQHMYFVKRLPFLLHQVQNPQVAFMILFTI